ncbi:MAG TPA: hypothetical protein VJQ57_13660 [Acidimicrobiia bacterium]|nr:hypothetical protein [Acidimicrobiia bacterium]
MDYSKIVADPDRGREIALDYQSAPSYDPRAEAAYVAFRNETVRQWEELRQSVELTVSATDPYTDYADMIADVATGHLAVLSTAATGGHPFMTDAENDMFRAVHDYHGHFSTGRDFSRHGEEAAWFRHSRMYSDLARSAMTTETRGQNSVFIWLNGGREFPEQKLMTLDRWSR